MADDWILDVLSDLRDFASQNGLGATEIRLKQTMVAVEDDLASMEGIAQGTAQNIGHVGELSRAIAESRNS